MQYQELLEEELHKTWRDFNDSKKSELRDKLVEHYVPLVKYVAGRVAISLPSHVDRDDLLSSGFFGLLDAIEKFDLSRGIKFETYATLRVRGAMLDFLRSEDWLPATVRQKVKNYEQVLAKLENGLGRSATDDEIAKALDIDVGQLQDLLSKMKASTIIPLEDFLAVETITVNTPSPTKALEEQETKRILAQAIERLPHKERLVISLYYNEELTLKEISLIMHLSEARISQLHTKAVMRLRSLLPRNRVE